MCLHEKGAARRAESGRRRVQSQSLTLSALRLAPETRVRGGRALFLIFNHSQISRLQNTTHHASFGARPIHAHEQTCQNKLQTQTCFMNTDVLFTHRAHTSTCHTRRVSQDQAPRNALSARGAAPRPRPPSWREASRAGEPAACQRNRRPM